jgi:DNA-binding HxlR family transcriptional regulator
MRSYGQYCGLSKALDVVGDRWSLLIVRELLIRDGCRYTDLRNGLPGIATNLLADRLRHLEDAGVIEREEAPPPVATTLFRLTPRGRELETVMMLLGRWGHPLLADAPKGDAFCSHWLVMPARHSLSDHAPDRPPVTLELRAGDEPVSIEAAAGAISAWPGTAENPDAVISGPPRVVIALLRGDMALDQAQGAGLRLDGDARVLYRMQPRAKNSAKNSSKDSVSSRSQSARSAS